MSKLLILGDSIMKGVVYSEERHRHTMLSAGARPLNTLMEKGGMAVENHARFGATSQMVLHEAEKYLSAVSPDTTVLFGFGGNDSDHDWNAISLDPAGEHAPKASPGQLTECWQRCLCMARDAGCRIMAANLVPIDPVKYFSWISEGKNAENILRWLGDISTLYRWHEDYNNRITDVCRRENVPVVDLREPFLLSRRFKHLLGADGIHPSEEGYALVDSAIAKAVLA